MAEDITRLILRQILRKGGLTVYEFNGHSKYKERAFESLLEDVRSSHVHLSVEKGTIYSIRLRAGALLRVPHLRIAYREVGRTYPDGSTLEQKEVWTISGTRHKGEDMVETAKREVAEETGHLLRDEDFNYGLFDLYSLYSDKPSRVYYRVRSRVWTQVFTCDLKYRPLDKNGEPWRDTMTFEDDRGTLIHVQAFPY